MSLLRLSRHNAVAGSKKQSFKWPTWSVRARWASIARSRPLSAILPGNGSKFLLDTIILGRETGRGRAGHGVTTTMRLVLGDDIVELTERAFLLDLLAEARR